MRDTPRNITLAVLFVVVCAAVSLPSLWKASYGCYPWQGYDEPFLYGVRYGYYGSYQYGAAGCEVEMTPKFEELGTARQAFYLRTVYEWMRERGAPGPLEVYDSRGDLLGTFNGYVLTRPEK